ncbi:Vmc-like lipoprotein signal peptide domain-containing protein [Burkholderia sp. Ed8]
MTASETENRRQTSRGTASISPLIAAIAASCRRTNPSNRSSRPGKK